MELFVTIVIIMSLLYGVHWLLSNSAFADMGSNRMKGVRQGYGIEDDFCRTLFKQVSSVQTGVADLSVKLDAIEGTCLGHVSPASDISTLLSAFKENFTMLNSLLAMHAELARMRLGMDHKDPEGALARLKADLEKLKGVSIKRYESLSRKAGSLLAELERVKDEYEVAQLLQIIDSAHTVEISKALETPR